MPDRMDHVWNKPFLRIGHGGASGHARANSLRSLSCALDLGVDVVEFDVRACRDALILEHDDNLAHYGNSQLLSQITLDDLRRLDPGSDGPIPTLADALDLIKGHALINIDLKAEGYEAATLEMVRAKGMLGDVLFSSLIPASLQRLRQIDSQVKTGISYPEDRGNASGNPYMKPIVNVVVALMRLTLAYRIRAMIANAQADAVMLYHKVVSQPTVDTVHRAGKKIFVWTVDDPAQLQRIQNLGVNGIASNYPDRFAKVQ